MSVRWFRWFCVTLLAWTVLVILWGTFVRATGSGAGCGAHWPLCDGEVIPRAPSTERFIEFTHRATSGLAGLLSLGVMIAAVFTHAKGHRVRKAAGAQLFLMITESLVGAGLVIFEYVAHDTSEARALWVVAHLVNTFALLAAMTVLVWWAYGGPPLQLKNQGKVTWLTGSAILATLLVGVTGAIAALGATLFPVTSLGEGLAADLSPTAHLFVRLRLIHLPVAVATALWTGVVAAIVAMARPSEWTRRFAIAVGVIFLFQLGLGTVNLVLHAPVALQVLHLLVADAAWIALILLTVTALSQPAPAEGWTLDAAPA